MVIATFCCLFAGIACLFAAQEVIRTSYEGCLLRAADASCVENEAGMSDAEALYAQALALSPKGMEAYRGLLGVYEYDFKLTEAEERRLRKAFAKVNDLADDPLFAQLCFDVGTCYLSYFGIDQSGGSVGNAALSSIDAAAPWFKRVVDQCDKAQGNTAPVINATDVRAAQSYSIIAEFHQNVARAGREGRSSSDEYASFWSSLSGCLATENALQGKEKSPEGVRVRLCQVAVESTASSTYLLGLSRAGVTEDQVKNLLGEVRACMDDVADFVSLEECRVVYGPVFEEIREGLVIADRTLRNVYESPVARMSNVEGEV